jgi:uncharacterized iron-regulated membrane protein
MSLSGAALVFHDELDRMQFPVVPGPVAKILPVDSCYNSLHKQFPQAQISNCTLPADNVTPFIFMVYDSSYRGGTSALQVFVNPATGAIIGKRSDGDSKGNFMNWVAVLHNSLHLGKTGEWLLGFFSVVFLLSLFTGIILYRKKIIPVILFRKAVFKKNNLHQLIGIYALLFNFMIGVTGFWMQRYVFKKEFYSNAVFTPVLQPSPGLFFNMDSSVEKARQRYPGFTAAVIYFSQSKKSHTAVYGSRNTNSFIHSKKYADVLFMDSVGAITSTAFVNDIDPASRYDIINAQVHYGQYGGLPVKIAYSFFALSSGMMSITGFLLWWRRRKRYKYAGPL